MNIISSSHPQSNGVLAYYRPIVKKTVLTQPVTHSFVSPHDALPLSCTYVTVQLSEIPVHKTAYFSNNLFFGIEDQCAYKLNDVIRWKPCFNEGFHAIA
jgi:hypothetical protein